MSFGVFVSLFFFALFGDFGGLADAAPVRRTVGAPPASEELRGTDPLEVSISYGFTTDLAEETQPRAYSHSFDLGLRYLVQRDWSFGGTLSAVVDTIDGKVNRSEEETLGEKLGPIFGLLLVYSPRVERWWSWRAVAGSRWPGDEASRREGYQAIPFAGVGLTWRLFSDAWVIDQDLRISEVVNSFATDTEGRSNPGQSASYNLVNVLRLTDLWRFEARFGIKTTRYLDGFLGYTYNNGIGLTARGEHWEASVSYINGGFIDDGKFSMWFVDEFRRLITGSVAYVF